MDKIAAEITQDLWKNNPNTKHWLEAIQNPGRHIIGIAKDHGWQPWSSLSICKKGVLLKQLNKSLNLIL